MTPTAPYPHQRLKLKTYSHLMGAQRMPSQYDLVTSRLLYYADRGFEVQTPIADWYRTHRQGSAFKLERDADWDRFRDPRETTYSRYTALQKDQELFLDGIDEAIAAKGYDRGLSNEALEFLKRFFIPLRYPFHALEMISAYIGSMAPSGRIAIASMFQAADEKRRIHRIAMRAGQLAAAGRLSSEEIKVGSHEAWMRAAEFRPLRETIESLLVTYDWGEAFVALNLVLKPVIDEVSFSVLPAVALRLGDHHLSDICFSLYKDSLWHKQWSNALVQLAVESRPENRDAIAVWAHRWAPRARAIGRVFDEALASLKAAAPDCFENPSLTGAGEHLLDSRLRELEALDA